jgi:hypothetical protein
LDRSRSWGGRGGTLGGRVLEDLLFDCWGLVLVVLFGSGRDRFFCSECFLCGLGFVLGLVLHLSVFLVHWFFFRGLDFLFGLALCLFLGALLAGRRSTLGRSRDRHTRWWRRNWRRSDLLGLWLDDARACICIVGLGCGLGFVSR